MSMTIRETRPGESKISLRSKPGVNVSDICAVYGGEATPWPPAARLRPGLRRRWSSCSARWMKNGRRTERYPARGQARGLDEPRRSRQAAEADGAEAHRPLRHTGPDGHGPARGIFGRATRAVEFAEGHDKAYTALLRPGLVTDTLDTTGRVLESTGLRPTRAELEAVLPAFRGEIEQLPPMYSAIKQGGKKLYEIARAAGRSSASRGASRYTALSVRASAVATSSWR